jgi:hypothetical protein
MPEPRVFRAGDPEPTDVAEVRHTSSQRFQACVTIELVAGVEVSRSQCWTDGGGDPLDWADLTRRLGSCTLTEVARPDQGGLTGSSVIVEDVRPASQDRRGGTNGHSLALTLDVSHPGRERRSALAPIETWRPVAGYEEIYEVSDIGRLRGPKGIRRPVLAKSASLVYRRAMLSGVGTPKNVGIHRLVLTTFSRPPEPEEVARHLDGDSLNNCIENLAWGTALENSMDSRMNGTLCRRTCPNGHEYTAEETVRRGGRRCGICIIAAAFSLRPSDALALDAALFLLMNLKTWTPR